MNFSNYDPKKTLTAIKVIAMESREKLPPGWIKVKSKSRAGMCYFFNETTKQAVWKISDLKSPEKLSKMKSSSPKKPSSTGVSSKSINIGKKNIAESRMKNLKVALEKERNNEESTGCAEYKPKQSNNKPKALFPPKPKVRSPEKKPRIGPHASQKRLLSPRKRVEAQSKSEAVDMSMDVDMVSLSQENNNKPEDYFEPMDWEEINIEEIVKEVHNIRSIKSGSSSLIPTHDIGDDNHDDKFYIVVDTNIFCSNPQFIERIKGRMFKGELIIFF